MTINIPINVSSAGGAKTISEFEAIRKAMQQTADQADNITALAQALGTTYKEAKQLAKEMGLTADQAAKAVTQLRQLRAVGADAATQFQVLAGKLGVTESQFQGLSKQLDNAQKKSSGLGSGLQKGLSGLTSGAAGTVFAFNQVVLALQAVSVAAQQAYGLLIGQNVELQKQLLSTQASLAATNKVVVDGAQITDPTAAIQALEKPVQDAIARIREGSLQLVGVTSGQIVPLFQIIATQSAQIGASLDQSADLSLSFAAALQTLNIPLEQAREEINSILTGQISQDSQLAKSLGLNNEMVNQWKNQGVLVDELNKKLAAFRAGNALAAKTLDGVSSNIIEVLQEVTRVAGQPLLDALVTQLNKLYEFIQLNKDALIQFATEASARFLIFAESVGESVFQIGEALAPAIKDLGPVAADVTELILQGFQSLAAATAVIAKSIGPAVQGAVQVAATLTDALQKAREIVALTTGGFDDSTQAVEASGRAVAQLSEQSIALQGRLQAAIAAKNAAQEEGRKLTADEIKANQGLEQQRQGLVGALQAELKALNAQIPIGEENTRNLEAQKKELQSRIKALQSDSVALEDNAKKVRLVADANVAARQKLAGIQQQGKAGLLDENQALKELNAIRTNNEVGKELRKEAADEALKIRKNQTDAELSLLDAQKAQIDARVKAGTLSEAQAQKQLTEIQKQEIQKRLQLNREQQANARGSDKQKLVAEEQKLQAELSSVQSEANKARYDRARKDIDEANTKALEANKARYDRARKDIDEANAKALAASKLAETQRQQEIQKLQNQGLITAQQAEEQRSQVKLNSIDKEIAAERKKFAEIKKLSTTDPAAAKARERDLAASQQRLADLTLQRLQEQGQAEERLRQVAIAAIKQQQQLEQAARRETIALVNEKAAALDKERIAQEAVTRSVDRQAKLLESANSLAKARANAEQAGYQIQIDGLSKAIDLLRQFNSESDPRKKQQQGELLAALGISTGTKELELVQAKQRLEDKLAAAKERARQAEQVAAQNQLDLSLKKAEIEARLQLIAAKRAELEAQISVEKAKQAVSDAKSELSQARLIKDPKEREAAVATAQAGLTEANQGLRSAQQQQTLAREGVQVAQQNLTDVTQMADKQREILAIQQASENAIALQAEGMRQLNQVLELSQSGAEGFAAALQKAANASGLIRQALGGSSLPQARYKGGDINPGQTYTVAEQGPEIIQYPDGSLDYILNPTLLKPKRRGHVLNAAETATFLAAQRPASVFSQATVSQISAFSGDRASQQLSEIKGEVQKLGKATRELAYTPRNLTLSGGATMTDAIEYSRELQRQRLRGGGL